MQYKRLIKLETKLSQEIIIQTAFAILAETQELSKLSMRNLAFKANVKAPAIYWYFKNKQELLQKWQNPWKISLLFLLSSYLGKNDFFNLWKITMIFTLRSLRC